LNNQTEILGKNKSSNWSTRLIAVGNIFWTYVFPPLIIMKAIDFYLLEQTLFFRNNILLVAMCCASLFFLIRLFLGYMFAPNPFMKVANQYYPEDENRDLYEALSYAVPSKKKFIVKGFLSHEYLDAMHLHYENGTYVIFVNAYIKFVFDKSADLGRKLIGSLYVTDLLNAPKQRILRAFDAGVFASFTLSSQVAAQKLVDVDSPHYSYLNAGSLNKLKASWIARLITFPFSICALPGSLFSRVLLNFSHALDMSYSNKKAELGEIFSPIGFKFNRNMDAISLREVDLVYWDLYPNKKPDTAIQYTEYKPSSRDISKDKVYKGNSALSPFVNFIFLLGLKAIFLTALLAMDAVLYYLKFLGYDYDLPYIAMIGFPAGLLAGYRHKKYEFYEVASTLPLDPERYELLYRIAQSFMPRKRFILYPRRWLSSKLTMSYLYDNERGIYLVLVDSGIVDAFDTQPKTTAEFLKYRSGAYFGNSYLCRFWEQVYYSGLHPLLVQLKNDVVTSFEERGYDTITYVHRRAYTDFRSDTTETTTRRSGGTFQLIGMALIYPYTITAGLYSFLVALCSKVLFRIPKQVEKVCDETYSSLPENPLIVTKVCEPDVYNKMTKKERNERKSEVIEWFRQFR
jgi:hypothetical protein